MEILILVWWLFASAVVAGFAQGKVITSFGAFMISLVGSPIFGILCVLASKPQKPMPDPVFIVDTENIQTTKAFKIGKLAMLLELGAITKEEFKKQQDALLNS